MKKEVYYLKNWKECDFKSEVNIEKIEEGLFKTHNIDGHQSLGTLQSLKKQIRLYNAIKSTPKYKWIKK